ncbi:MAG TPA: NifU family protein [Bdellovibrio sp.]|uniref:NifU family protein n=1 Tax=Bdellovibrio sp. TaxID=28201 RepID=UPI002EDE59E4
MSKITFETTPNPSTMKFLLHTKVADQGFDCPTAQDAERSPLAAKIFGFPWTSAVYVGTDFITVTKQDWVDWELLAHPLSGLIQEHMDRNEPVVVEMVTTDEEYNENDSTIVRNIKSVLNREIRPVVALDGGDILFHKFEGNTLYIHMKGACAGCPSSSVTLKEGVEVRMKELFPEIHEVVAV